jgi:hypothetical protein
MVPARIVPGPARSVPGECFPNGQQQVVGRGGTGRPDETRAGRRLQQVTADMRNAASDGRVWPEAKDNPRNNTPGGACELVAAPTGQRTRCNYAAVRKKAALN